MRNLLDKINAAIHRQRSKPRTAQQKIRLSQSPKMRTKEHLSPVESRAMRATAAVLARSIRGETDPRRKKDLVGELSLVMRRMQDGGIDVGGEYWHGIIKYGPGSQGGSSHARPRKTRTKPRRVLVLSQSQSTARVAKLRKSGHSVTRETLQDGTVVVLKSKKTRKKVAKKGKRSPAQIAATKRMLAANKASKKTRKKVAKKGKKKARSGKRSPAQIAATKRMLAANRARRKK